MADAQVGCGEERSDFADGVVHERVVVGHERSPVETTHNDLRFAVEALSGGLLLTMYAGCSRCVRVGRPIQTRHGSGKLAGGPQVRLADKPAVWAVAERRPIKWNKNNRLAI